MNHTSPFSYFVRPNMHEHYLRDYVCDCMCMYVCLCMWKKRDRECKAMRSAKKTETEPYNNKYATLSNTLLYFYMATCILSVC